jgi:hypothetical protein
VERGVPSILDDVGVADEKEEVVDDKTLVIPVFDVGRTVLAAENVELELELELAAISGISERVPQTPA